MANYLIRSGDTLGQIAQANQTDIATLQKLNPQVTNPNLIIAGQSLNLPTTPIAPAIPTVQPASAPTIQSVQQGLNDLLKGFGGTLSPQTGQINITAEQLTAATQPKAIDVTSPPSTLGTSASAMVAGATADSTALQKYIDLMTPKETPESKQYKDLMAQIQSELPSVTGRGTAQLAAEQAQGVPEKIQALQDVQNQINTKIAEFNKVEADYMATTQATETVPGVTKGIVAGQQNQLAKALNIAKISAAAEISMLQSQAQALQGNLTTAQATADRAVTLRFQDVRDSINIRLQQIQLIEPELNKQEQRRADAIKLYLNQQQQIVDEQKSAQKELVNFNLSAMQDYPSANIQISDPYHTTQNKIINSKEYKLATTTKVISADEQLYSGLSAATATAVRSKVSKFSTEPIIQNYATIQEGRNFASVISDTTTNPADDQALIYSLAKALDPGSVVREGEYATAQKYSQSWIQAYGKSVTQALLGTGFLSQEARQNIKKTIEQKYLSSKRSYDNLYNQYEASINSLTGRNDGNEFLMEYTTPEISPEIPPTTPPETLPEQPKTGGGLFGNFIQGIIKAFGG